MKIEPADDFSLDGRDSALDYPPIATIEMKLEQPQHQPFPPRAMRSRSSSAIAPRYSPTPPPELHPYYGPIAPLSRAAQASIRPSPLSVQSSGTNGDEPRAREDWSHTQDPGEISVYMCNVCGKQFDRVRADPLVSPGILLTIGAAYACGLPGCGALFNTKSNATRHRRIHNYAEAGETGPLEPPPSVYPKPVRFVYPITYSSGSSSAYPISSSASLRQYMHSA
ncbi:hypothetical protein FB451DRAFT_1288889 [Mycena latifolia]|nr:hypothetical protein FB451DRAFT_1288889 [Mycena latifolia]